MKHALWICGSLLRWMLYYIQTHAYTLTDSYHVNICMSPYLPAACSVLQQRVVVSTGAAWCGSGPGLDNCWWWGVTCWSKQDGGRWWASAHWSPWWCYEGVCKVSPKLGSHFCTWGETHSVLFALARKFYFCTSCSSQFCLFQLHWSVHLFLGCPIFLCPQCL